MRRTPTWAAAAGLLVVQAGVVGEARAAFVSASQSFFLQDQVRSEVAGSYTSRLSDSASIALPRFDPSFGTLTSVDLSFTSSYSLRVDGSASDGTGEADVLPFPPILYNFRNDTGLSALLNTNLTLAFLDPALGSRTDAPLVRDACAGSNTFEFFPAESCTFAASVSNVFDGSVSTSLLDLALFQGSDPLDIFALATGVLSGVCDFDDRGDVCTAGTSLTWSGTVAVRYTYDLLGDGGTGGGTGGGAGGGGGTGGGGDSGGGGSVPVPEPGTLALFATSLIACMLRRARPSRRESAVAVPA